MIIVSGSNCISSPSKVTLSSKGLTFTEKDSMTTPLIETLPFWINSSTFLLAPSPHFAKNRLMRIGLSKSSSLSSIAAKLFLSNKGDFFSSKSWNIVFFSFCSMVSTRSLASFRSTTFFLGAAESFEKRLPSPLSLLPKPSRCLEKLGLLPLDSE